MAHVALNAWLRHPLDSDSRSISDDSSDDSSNEGTFAKRSPEKPLPSSSSPAVGKCEAAASRPTPARHLIFTTPFVSFYTFTGHVPHSSAKTVLRFLSDALSQGMNLYADAYPSEPRTKLHTVLPATMPTASLDAESRLKRGITHLLEEGEDVQSSLEVARMNI